VASGALKQHFGHVHVNAQLRHVMNARPTRAEARRSERSQRHVVLSLTATRDLALALAIDTPDLAGDMQRAFDRALARAETLEDPGFANVDDPAQRFRLEALKQQIDDIRTRLITDLGPSLGVTVGFNSLDGD
ncbi:MAG: peptidase M75, partial [Rhodobacteraceae bacterium]|nr:peptidase M75 [Paracoccaceae bacterium]